MDRLRFIHRTGLGCAFLALLLGFTISSGQAQVCPFDDGNSSLTVEGVILTRYALGITGAPLVASTGINAVDAPSVEATINCSSCGLNITGNPTLTVADATIISRKLAGFTGAQLTDGLALGSGTRNTPAAVQSFLLAGCGATGGTVTSITAGTGLTGGTITTTGTINLAATQLMPTTACATNQIPKWNGTAWACAADGAGSAGTVTNVATGAGLTGGPISTTGTINLAGTQLLPTVACATNQIAKWNGSAWACAADATGGSGTVTGIATGIGLGGGPITTAGTINIDPTFRLPQSCTANQFARFNASTNLWECFTATAVTSVATGSGLTGGPITATGTINLAATQLLPTTACANGEVAKWNGTAWACAAAATGSGTVTSVATGPGLTGGPITATGTVSLAITQLLPTTACTTDQIIKWNGTAWVCASSLLTLPATCVRGQTLGIDPANGSVRCASLPSTLSTAYTAAGSLSSFKTVATAVGLDGLPVIAFASGLETLVIVKCGNVPCNSGNIVMIADASAPLFSVLSGSSVSIAIPADGKPVISYAYEPSGGSVSLRVLKCGNAFCSSGNTTSTVDATVTVVGRKNAIAISPIDGFPIISYHSGTDRQIKVAKCGNAACSAATLSLVAAAPNDTTTSIAVRANGNPLVVYKPDLSTTWAMMDCGNPQCSSGNSTPSFDTATRSGVAHLMIPSDGIPVIVYGVSASGVQLKVAKCGDANCSAGNTYTTVDTSLSGALAPVAMALAADGFPILTYLRSTGGLIVLKCGNASCSTANTSTSVNAALNYTVVGAIAVPSDGLPLIPYFDFTDSNDQLKVLKCSDALCGNF